MLEDQVRQLLKLSASDNIEEALKAAARTREVASGSGENTVVSLFDYNIRLEKILTLERSLAESNANNARLKDEHAQELRRRDATALVGKAVEEGKITPHMADAWGKDMAFNDPTGFVKVLASMPRIVRVGTEEGSNAQAVVMAASQQVREEVKKLAEDYTKAGKPVPKLADLQNEVFTRSPKLYTEYTAEVRGAE